MNGDREGVFDGYYPPAPAAPSEKPQRDVLALLAELRQIYGVPQSLIDELAEMDRQFHAALSATGRSAVIEECIARLIQVDAPRMSVEALRALDRRNDANS